MKLILGGMVVAAALSGSALAADLPSRGPMKAAPMMVDPSYNWSGLYIGVSAGAAWTKDSARLNAEASPYFQNSLDTASNDASAFSALGSRDFKQSTGIFGGKAGYNWQVARWVVGLEGDFSSLRFRQSVTITGNPHAGFDAGSSIFNDQVSADWLATVRSRVGYAYDRALFYGTAGVAFAHSNLQSSIRDFAPHGTGFGTALVAASPIKIGWAAGAGIDYAVSNNWIVSVEYLHADLGKVNAAGLITDNVGRTAAVAYSAKLTSDIVRAGIGYKF
jgi:outer membrane immunogenic protein